MRELTLREGKWLAQVTQQCGTRTQTPALLHKAFRSWDWGSTPALGNPHGQQGVGGGAKTRNETPQSRELVLGTLACRLWVRISFLCANGGHGGPGRGRGREREADANPHSTEGKPSLVEALCWPPPPSCVAPTLGLRACGLPAWVWWSEAMAGCPVQE